MIKNKRFELTELLNDLEELGRIQGIHFGRWEEERNMDFSADEYLFGMKKMAKKYSVEYNNNLSDYIEDREESECYTVDNMGYTIYLKTKDKILELIYIEKNKPLKKDLEIISKNLKENKWELTYDNIYKEWRINGNFIEDFFWYGDEYQSLTHPKELKEEVEKLIEYYVH